MGAVRKITGWDLTSTIDEYKAYAVPKVRECDVEYITGFQPSSVVDLVEESTAVTTVGFRVPNFVRVILFATVVLAIWMLSGSKIAAASPKRSGSKNEG